MRYPGTDGWGVRDPLRVYKDFGPERPDVVSLHYTTSRLYNSSRLVHLVPMADMFIDLATIDHGEEPTTYLNEAASTLDYAIRKGKEAKDEQREELEEGEESLRVASPWLVKAILRKAELGNWVRAIHEEPVILDYAKMLDAASEAAKYEACSTTARAHLVEFMPLLLSARHASRTGDTGNWSGTGRLSLFREDQGPIQGSNINPNWDIGLSKDHSPREFLQPSTRIDTTTATHNKKGNARELGGTIVLDALRHGIHMPRKIVRSLSVEAGLEATGHTVFTTEKLDALTASVFRGIRRSQRRVHRTQVEYGIA